MKESMETQRLILTKFDDSDAEFLYELNNNKETNKYRSSSSISMKKCIESIKSWKEKFDSKSLYGSYKLSVKADNIPIGLIFLGENHGQIELGFRLLPEHWRKGYCQEAAKVLIAKHFLKNPSEPIIAETHPENENTVSFLLNMGFKEKPHNMENRGRIFILQFESFTEIL